MKRQLGFTAYGGFTLIEVMVAMVILAFLSFFTSQSIQAALKAKTRVQKATDKNATLRDALRVMERDVNMAFNYRSPYVELYNKAQDARVAKAIENARKGKPNPNPTPTPGTPPPIAGAPVDEAAIKEKYPKRVDTVVTQFQGKKDTLNFSTLSNIRMTEDSMMDTQSEIGYFLKSCRRRSTQEQSSNCLWRRVANYIDKDIDKGGEETVLLENVESFELRYLGPGKEDEWQDTWVTGEGAETATAGKFPYAVEITLSVADPDAKGKPLKMVTVAAIRNPNNPEEAAGAANPTAPK
jgi:prepilin-type N-terminal cleavage/methylation domain-containing protein